MTGDVTAVVPSIGTRHELATRAVRSIASQSGNHLKKIIVVDASGAGRVPDNWHGVADNLVLVVRSSRPLLAGEARQLGSDHAETRWVAYCDDDDLWAPEKLRHQMAALAATRRRWCTTNAVRFVAGPRLLYIEKLPDTELLSTLQSCNAIPGGGSGVVVERSFVYQAGGWASDLTNAEDWDMWLRLSAEGPPAHVDLPLVGYRVHLGNKSASTDRMISSRQTIIERNSLPSDGPPVERWMVDRCLDAGDTHGARCLARQMQIDPRDLWLRLYATAVRGFPIGAAAIRRMRQAGALSPELDEGAFDWLSDLEHHPS